MNVRRNRCALSILLLMLATATFASAQRFIRAPIYSAGNPSLSVATGDFNGDGDADLAFLSNANPAVVTIRLGTGDGKFSKGQQITLSNYAISIITGDWNNDGVLDLAATISKSPAFQSVSILLGNGDGTFTFHGEFDTGELPGLFATGDVNGDGLADFVVAVRLSKIAVLLGLGGGNFSAPLLLAAGDFPTTGVALGDFNRDGKPDIAATDAEDLDGLSSLLIFLGNGDGTFASPTSYATTLFAFSNPVVADFNHDGIPDVAVNGSLVSIYLGKGDGTLNPQTTYPGTPSASGGATLSADLNKDGNPDLIMVDHAGNIGVVGSNIATVLLGSPDGTFKGASLFGTGPCAQSLAVADFNNDANLDIAAADGNYSNTTCDSNFVELLGDGTGKLTTRRDFVAADVVGCCANIISVAAGNLDSDGNLDLVAVNDLNLKITVLIGNKNGAFRPGKTYFLQRGPKWVTIADVNGDHKDDVIAANSKNNTVSVLLGNGNGTLQPEVAYATGNDPVFVTAADVNGDGKLDLLTANQTGNTFSVLLASGSTFLPHVDYSMFGPVQLALGDFNGDGKLDVFAISSNSSSKLFLGKGDGTFSAGTTVTNLGFPVSVAVGDLNHDGKLDLVIVNNGSVLIYSFLGNGDGTFAPPLTSLDSANANQIKLADFDGDGKLDAMLVAGDFTGNAAAVFLPGKGDGTFRQAQVYTVDNSPSAEVVADFNRDGALDVVTANGAAGSISVLLNTGIK